MFKRKILLFIILSSALNNLYASSNISTNNLSLHKMHIYLACINLVSYLNKNFLKSYPELHDLNEILEKKKYFYSMNKVLKNKLPIKEVADLLQKLTEQEELYLILDRAEFFREKNNFSTRLKDSDPLKECNWISFFEGSKRKVYSGFIDHNDLNERGEATQSSYICLMSSSEKYIKYLFDSENKKVFTIGDLKKKYVLKFNFKHNHQNLYWQDASLHYNRKNMGGFLYFDKKPNNFIENNDPTPGNDTTSNRKNFLVFLAIIVVASFLVYKLYKHTNLSSQKKKQRKSKSDIKNHV